MLISPGSTCFVSSSNIDQGGGGRVGAKRELIFHTSDRSLVQKQSFLNNFVQDCSHIIMKLLASPDDGNRLLLEGNPFEPA